MFKKTALFLSDGFPYHHRQNHHHHHLDKKELEAECGKNPNPLTFSIQEMMARDKRLPQPFFSTTMQIYELTPHFRELVILFSIFYLKSEWLFSCTMRII